VTVNNVGAAAHAFASGRPIRSFPELEHADVEAYRRLAAALLDEGVHVIPRGLLYVSTEHTPADLATTRDAVRRAAAAVAANRRDS
jgi:glutamate-1-semialdehyde 2,1-aminomutase